MASSLSNLVHNLAKGIHNIKCKYGHDNEKCEECRIKYRDCEFCFKHTSIKEYLTEYKCLCCNKN